MDLVKYSRITIYCLVAVVALSSCAKKNNDLKARLNAAGARDINQQVSQVADAAAAAMNFDVDFVNINAPVASGNGLSVTTKMRLNTSYYEITTTHSTFGANSQPATANQTINGGNFAIHAVCGNEYCNPYYLIVNITANGRQVKQMGQMKFFYYTGAQSQYDWFFSRGEGQFFSVPQAINELNVGSQQVTTQEQ